MGAVWMFSPNDRSEAHFIFVEPLKRLSCVGVLTNGAVHADIISDISDCYAPIILWLS